MKIVIIPLYKIIIDKIKYGNSIKIVYFPFFGAAFEAIVYSVFKYKSAFKATIEFSKKNPQIKCYIGYG